MVKTIAAVVAVALGSFALPVSADTVAAIFGFRFIGNESNVASTANAVAPQLQVELTDGGNSAGGHNFVHFKFTNSGQLASSICDIYFDDGTLLGLPQIYGMYGQVRFAEGASPNELPGAKAIVGQPAFVTSVQPAPNPNSKKQSFIFWNIDSDSPVSKNGVGPDEYLVIRYQLQLGKTFEHTIDMLTAGAALRSGDDPDNIDGKGTHALRIGLHVQGMDRDYSASFINEGPIVPAPGSTPVPLPASVWAGLALLGGMGTFRLIRHRRMADGV